MNKNLLRVTIAVLFLAAVTLMAGGSSNPKSTGSAGWVNPYWGGQQATTTFAAIAVAPTGLAAKGSLVYSDPQITYTMDVQFLKVDGNAAWFAGMVTSVSNPGNVPCCSVGNWILYKVVDNAEPGIGQDQVYGQDLGAADISSVIALVAGEADPNGGPFQINSGNIQVH